MLLGRTNFKSLLKKILNYEKLRIFRCLCISWLKPYSDHKLQPPLWECLFLGYAPGQSFVCLFLEMSLLMSYLIMERLSLSTDNSNLKGQSPALIYKVSKNNGYMKNYLLHQPQIRLLQRQLCHRLSNTYFPFSRTPTQSAFFQSGSNFCSSRRSIVHSLI